MQKELTEWLVNHKLKMRDLQNIAFVAKRSYEDLTNGKNRPIPALYRLFLVTGLRMFELSPEEMKEYDLDKRDGTRIDEKICKFFTKDFIENHRLPESNFALAPKGARVRNDKKVVTENILKEYFSGNGKVVETTDSDIAQSLKAVHYGLTKLFQQHSVDEINLFKKQHSADLTGILNLINLLNEKDPKSAFNKLNNTNLFKQKKYVTR